MTTCGVQHFGFIGDGRNGRMACTCGRTFEELESLAAHIAGDPEDPAADRRNRQRLLIGMLSVDEGILRSTKEAVERQFPEYEIVVVAGTTGLLLLPPGEGEGEG